MAVSVLNFDGTEVLVKVTMVAAGDVEHNDIVGQGMEIDTITLNQTAGTADPTYVFIRDNLTIDTDASDNQADFVLQVDDGAETSYEIKQKLTEGVSIGYGQDENGVTPAGAEAVTVGIRGRLL